MKNNLIHWDLQDGKDKLMVIEEDLRNLLKECSRLKSEGEEKYEGEKKRTKKMLINHLEALDAFDRVLKNIDDKGRDMDKQVKRWIGSFRAIRKLIERDLKESGVSLVESPEGKAIPGWHTIVETREVNGLVDDTIIETVQKGYLWRDEILRKASVITVNNNKREA